MELSKDILVEIVNCLSLRDVLNFTLTCKKHYKYIFENESFWLRRSEKELSFPVKKEKYKKIIKEIALNKYLLSWFHISEDDLLFYDMPKLSFEEKFPDKHSFKISLYNLSEEEKSLYEDLCNKMNHYPKNFKEEEKETLKRLIYKSINLDCKNCIIKLENTIKQYVYLGLLPLPTTSLHLQNIPLFFRDIYSSEIL